MRKYLEFIAPQGYSSGQETCQQGLQTSGPKQNTIVKECSDESGRPQLARANFSAAPQSGRSSATGAPPRPSTTAGPSLRCLPHRPSHRGRGTASAAQRINSRSPNRGRSYRREDRGVAVRNASWCFLDWRYRQQLLVLQSRTGKSLRFSNFYRLHNRWWLR